MAEEEVVMGVNSPAPSEHKRKLEDLESDAPEPLSTNGNFEPYDAATTNANANNNASDDDDDSVAKRPRLDETSDALVDKENGREGDNIDEPKEEAVVVSNVASDSGPVHAEQQADEAQATAVIEVPAADDNQTEAAQNPSAADPQSENDQDASAEGDYQEPAEELQKPLSEASQQETVYSREEQKVDGQLTSRKMEVPSNKVGVLIGKAGDTIRILQNNSGARIQITRDSDADPSSGTRPVELIGSLESIIKAEKLIKDVIAEADAGGSPALVARGFGTVHASGASEEIQLQVPNERVGLIIGKGGETIKSLQTRSGARIQLLPQHQPEGDQAKERTVRVTGGKKQIEMAREMIKEAMNQPLRSSSNSSGGYNQQHQSFRERGHAGSQWRPPRGPNHSQPTGYDYQHRGGSYQSQYPPQYSTPGGYGNYPPHQGPPRSNYGQDQRPPTNVQGPPSQTGYDYYGGQGGPTGAPPGPGMGPPPSSQAGYNNYAQPQAPAYGYSQNAVPHGGPSQHPYGGQASQPSTYYPQGTTHPSYGQQEQYGKPPPSSYNMPPQQGPYSQPRPSQPPGDVLYQGGPVPPSQSYGGPNPPAQQYGHSGPVQQGYPPYGSALPNDGYNQAAGYPQQTGAHQVPGYAQSGPTGAYGQYPPSAQGGYTEQAVSQNIGTGYGGYQGAADPNYAAVYGGPPLTGQQPGYVQPVPTQPGYVQPVPTQPGYDQSAVQPGYPQQQYDASQMYAGHR